MYENTILIKDYLFTIQEQLKQGNHCQFQPVKESNENVNDGIKYIKTIANNVFSIIALIDNTLACSSVSTIQIINPSYDYHCDQVITHYNEPDGTLVSSTEDFDILIGNHLIESAHDVDIKSIILLSNNRIASLSLEYTIKIWNSVNCSDIPITVLKEVDEDVACILYIKERDVMISGSSEGNFRIWDLSNYQCVSVINDVFCHDTPFMKNNNALYQIDKDRVIVGGVQKIYIVNIDKCIIEDTVFNDKFGIANCFLQLRDANTFICGFDKGLLCLYNIETKKTIITISDSKEDIYNLIKINEHSFVTYCSSNIVKLWKC